MSYPPHRPRVRVRRALAVSAVTVLGALAVVMAVDPGLLGRSTAMPAAPHVAVRHDAAAGGIAPAAARAKERVISVLPPDGSRFFGVSITTTAARKDLSAGFTTAVGVAPTMQMFFESFTETFDVTTARRITAAGRLPVLTWEPYDHEHPTADPFPLRSIASGVFDGYLRAEAQRFAAVDGPLVIRLAHEMNGDWYPWGVGIPGNTAADYVAAYRHVHQVVTAAGARNVVWVWAPNLIDADPSIALAPLYPGDDVVDWVGLSGYYTKSDDTFARRFSRTLLQVDAVAPRKPILLAETSVERTFNRSALIADLVNGIRSTPRMIGFVWFDALKRADWSLDNDPNAAAALAAAVRAGGFGAHPTYETGG